MNSLLEQFLSESRDALQQIGTMLMQLEKEPESSELITELFRQVHTLKGNSGLFDYPELTRVLHAGEDLMDAVRCGKVSYSPEMADRLLDAMDFVGLLCDEIEADGGINPSRANDSFRLAEMLRMIIGKSDHDHEADQPVAATSSTPIAATRQEEHGHLTRRLSEIPEIGRMVAFRATESGSSLYWLKYRPAEDCFFQGEDPFFQARQTPGLLWGGIAARQPWPKLTELDAYRCLLDFEMLSTASLEELNEFFRYVTDQVTIAELSGEALIIPVGDVDGEPADEECIASSLRFLEEGNLEGLGQAVNSMQELVAPGSWLASALRWVSLILELRGKEGGALVKALLLSLGSLSLPDWSATAQQADPAVNAKNPFFDSRRAEASGIVAEIVAAQRDILSLPDNVPWLAGRLGGVASVLTGCLQALGRTESLASLKKAAESAIISGTSGPLLKWLNQMSPPTTAQSAGLGIDGALLVETGVAEPAVSSALPDASPAAAGTSSAGESEVKFGRRAEDALLSSKVLKVDQTKIDRLMNLIGEMVVAKNALPYLAGRAESVYGVRDLSREIKMQYAVINRIAEEMQDSIMQVRMMPVSFIFQRFPRLVRDISHRLGKEVNLVLEGQDTEADKMIIEALGDPLVHIVRNSLDHGIEQPEVRLSSGKPSQGKLTIRASQESDRVIITIKDDGKGIDPEAIKRKAYEKGLLDEERLERITDQEAIQLVFAPGFSTAAEVSDLSGRGVGMDVVRTAVEKVNGTILLESRKNEGTCLRLSLPLSMAVTNVMIIESDRRIFGVPMDTVVETVRVRQSEVRSVKNAQTMLLRGRIIPLKGMNSLLGLSSPPKVNDDDEYAVLVVSHGEEPVGVIVDDFRESIDIILKPMAGVLTGLTAYSGSALLGDGSVLMVLNFKELL